jgi:hypothetical protein
LWISVYEYDNNSKRKFIIIQNSEYEIDDEVKCENLINDGNRTIYIDDYNRRIKLVVNALQELNCTSKESKIAVDYLTIKKQTTN